MEETQEQPVGNDAIIEYQLKYCGNILVRLKRNGNAGPFLQPVDPIALGIPDYAEKIQNPMDISTIKKKLESGVYKSPDDFNNDMLLMFNNCYTYNGPGSVVHEMGKDLQKSYDLLYHEMPMEIVKKNKVSTVSSPRLSEKPRRVVKSGEGMAADEYAFCVDVITDLEKSKHKKYSWPFLQPVTEEDAPGYFEVISNPMDLSSVRKKLDSRAYLGVQQFTGDLELITDNCYKFNPPESEVYKCSQEFEKMVKGLLGKQKDPDSRINELRKKISQLSSELRELEANKSQTKKVFSLNDRERIGQAIISMTKAQTEKVAEIVQRHCAYEYIDNDEIELNMQTISDEVVSEINEFIQKTNNEASELMG